MSRAMSNDSPDSATAVPLSAKIAFVVHLTGHATAADQPVTGRVEHVSSGRSMRFSSAGQLVDFMRRALSTGGPSADAKARDDSDRRDA